MHGELKKIKKKYGEDMAKLCRTLFPTILETPGLLYNILDSKFAHSRSLYNDIITSNNEINFKNYIYNLYNKVDNFEESNKTARDLLSEAGYDLYECKTEQAIQFFKSYYAKGEALCTFNGGRLDKCYVFFAVKKNVKEIKREDFKNPERQDLYGTSVISIQFTRDASNTLSIKNRYNHSVPNPDATYGNNLENIIPGLTRSFERDYGFNISCDGSNFELPGYVYAKDGKFYKYNYEINNIYYGPDNIIIDNFEVKKEYLDKSRYLIVDYFIIDLSKKKIILYDNTIKDSFLNGLGNIESIVLDNIKEKNQKKITINNDIVIILNDKNNIVEYHNEHLRRLDNDFLYNSFYLEVLSTPNVIKIGDNCLFRNRCMKKIDFPNVLYTGKRFLYHNKVLNEIHMAKVMYVGLQFCFCCESLEILDMPNLEQTGECFCNLVKKVKVLFFPKLKITGNSFMTHDVELRSLYAPHLEEAGIYFFTMAGQAEDVYMPKLSKINEGFFMRNLDVYKKYKKR